MPYPLDTASRAALAAGRIAVATLVDLYCKTSGGSALTLRAWTRPGDLVYPAADHITAGDATYANLYGRMRIDVAVRLNATWSAEPLVIQFDRSRAGDDEDWTGQFADADWHQRKMRVRQVLINVDTGASPTEPVWEWRGRMDKRTFTRGIDETPQITLTCEGGFFRIRGRRLHTRTDADQRRRKASDAFFALTPLMIARPPLWNRRSANVPGVSGGAGFWRKETDGKER